jgi:hypothetical protein
VDEQLARCTRIQQSWFSWKDGVGFTFDDGTVRLTAGGITSTSLSTIASDLSYRSDARNGVTVWSGLHPIS